MTKDEDMSVLIDFGNIPDGTDVLLVGTLPTWMAMMVGIEMWRDTRIGRLLNGVPNSSQFVVFDRMVEVME